MPTPSRLSTPALAGAAIAIGLLVVGVILLVGQLGTPAATSVPSTSAAAGATATATPTVVASTPEAAVRAFFAAYADARRTGDPAPVADLVTGPESSAYLSVAGFLEGQKAVEKASIVTVQEFANVTSTIDGATATVVLDLTEGGYDIRLADASPLESPQLLPPSRVTVHLALVDGRWLVDAFEAAP
jgi:hypothetical protein